MKRIILLISFATIISNHSKAQFISETVIGFPKYDLQTSNSAYNSIFLNSNGTVSTVWNFSPDDNQTTNPPFPNRGTGNNYFDRNTWDTIPQQRIDNIRTGFPNIGVTSSGREITISHDAVITTNSGICMNYRSQKGTGIYFARFIYFDNIQVKKFIVLRN